MYNIKTNKLNYQLFKKTNIQESKKLKTKCLFTLKSNLKKLMSNLTFTYTRSKPFQKLNVAKISQ